MREGQNDRHSRSNRHAATYVDNLNSPHEGLFSSPHHNTNASRSVDAGRSQHVANVIDDVPGQKMTSNSDSFDHQFLRGRQNGDSADRSENRRRSYTVSTNQRSFSLDGRMRMDDMSGSGARDSRDYQRNSLQSDDHRPSVLSRITFTNNSRDRPERTSRSQNRHSNIGEDEWMNNGIAAIHRESSCGDGHRSRRMKNGSKREREDKSHRSEHSSSKMELDHGGRRRSKTPPRNKRARDKNRNESSKSITHGHSYSSSRRENDRRDRRRSKDVTPPRNTSSNQRERGRSRKDVSRNNTDRRSRSSSRRENDRGDRKSTEDVTPSRNTSPSRDRGRSRNESSRSMVHRNSYSSSGKEHDREDRRKSRGVTTGGNSSSYRRDRERSSKDVSRRGTNHRSCSPTKVREPSRRGDTIRRSQLTLEHYFPIEPAANRRSNAVSRTQKDRHPRNKQPSTDDVEIITLTDSPEHRSSSLSDDEITIIGDSSGRMDTPLNVVSMSDNCSSLNKEGESARKTNKILAVKYTPYSQYVQNEKRTEEKASKRSNVFSEATIGHNTSHSSWKVDMDIESGSSSGTGRVNKKNDTNDDSSEPSHLKWMRLQQVASNEHKPGKHQNVQQHQHYAYQKWNPSGMDHLEQAPKASSENMNFMNRMENLDMNKIRLDSNSHEEHQEKKKLGREAVERAQEMDSDGKEAQRRDKIVNATDGKNDRVLPADFIKSPMAFKSPRSLSSYRFSISPYSQNALPDDMEVADVMISGLDGHEIKQDMLSEIHDPLNVHGYLFNNAPYDQNNSFGDAIDDMGFDLGNPILAMNEVAFGEEGYKEDQKEVGRVEQMGWDVEQVAVDGEAEAAEVEQRRGGGDGEEVKEQSKEKRRDVHVVVKPMDETVKAGLTGIANTGRRHDNPVNNHFIADMKTPVRISKLKALPIGLQTLRAPKIEQPLKMKFVLDHMNPSASVVKNAQDVPNNKDDSIIPIDQTVKKDGVLKDVVNLSLSSGEDDVLFLEIIRAQDFQEVKPVKKRAPKRPAVQSPPRRPKYRTNRTIKEEPLDYDENENVDYQMAKQLDKKENGYSLRNKKIKIERIDYTYFNGIYDDMITGDSDPENVPPVRSSKRMRQDSDSEFVPGRYETRRSTTRLRARMNKEMEMAGEKQYVMQRMIKSELLSDSDLTCGEYEADERAKKPASDECTGLKKVKQEVLEEDVGTQKKLARLKTVKNEVIDDSYDNISNGVTTRNWAGLKKVKAEVIDRSYDKYSTGGKVLDVIDLTKGVAVAEDIKFEPLRKALNVVKGPAKPSKNKKKDTRPKIKIRNKRCEDGIIYYVERVVAKIRDPDSTADQVYIVKWVSWNETACTLCSIDDLRGSMDELTNFKNYEIAVEKVFKKFVEKNSKNKKKRLPMPVMQMFDLLTNTPFCKKWMTDSWFETMKKSTGFLKKIGLNWYLKCLEREWTAIIQKAQPEAGGIRIISLFGHPLQESFTNFEFSVEHRYSEAALAEINKSTKNPNCSCKCREFCDFCVKDNQFYALGFLENNNINLHPSHVQTRSYAALRCGPLSDCPPDAPCRKLPYRTCQLLLCDMPKLGFGFGVFAIEPILQGSVIAEYTGETFVIGEVDPEASTNYQYNVNECAITDAIRFGNEARFINHSCYPNLATMVLFTDNRWSFPRIYLVAKRNIRAGEQLVVDYHPSYKDGDKERPANSSECECEAWCCRGWV